MDWPVLDRWLVIAETYEVDESMQTKLELKDASSFQRIETPARGGDCKRNDVPVFDLFKHMNSMVRNDYTSQQTKSGLHQQNPQKYPDIVLQRGAWACPFCGRKANCGVAWMDLEVDPIAKAILDRAPKNVDTISVYCAGNDPDEPPLPYRLRGTIACILHSTLRCAPVLLGPIADIDSCRGAGPARWRLNLSR